jgi:superfamily II DNA or RNA helicase
MSMHVVDDVKSNDSPLETAHAFRLESLTPGARVEGLRLHAPVDILAVRWHGGNVVTVAFKDAAGAIDEAVVTRDREASLRLVASSSVRAFDGDGESWRLAAEALRIRYAALFDPMLVVTSSDVEPLPHQITAVYGEMLPRTPLRFLLADDPGAGKTIMCGLYIKELMLRGDLDRCLVVAPGSLVNQWMDELFDKFGLRFELLTKQLVDATPEGLFEQHPLLIARMDQLSRSEELIDLLKRSDWDLVVVDEAHRMSASYFSGELKTTKRYQLGQVLGGVTRHFLLMTATPHAGQQEGFQLFLALLDGDRFEGKFRDGVHTVDPGDLMRRMVKEELLTMEGKPLFPERRAYTVPYDLSDDEQDLYEAVTLYVREEMNRADRFAAEGDRLRRNTVGFALTVLQRRLASSPEAILRSLERRRARLDRRRRELAGDAYLGLSFTTKMAQLLGRKDDSLELDDTLEDLDGAEVEELEEDVVDAATAARTLAELDHEIAALGDLVQVASRVRHSGTDRKWSELRDILDREEITEDREGNPRKIIVFTEHRDTLNYLVDRIASYLGRPEILVSIHGGHTREERRIAQQRFTQDPDTRVLVATDAAGEGLNLQRAHLMVNYDLPWNPNRIEQRFGRIHRIGQTEVCHLWNLVAKDTREGEVFIRLLDKIEEQRKAYGGDKVFDVLGDAFENNPLRRLLVEAIRYGDQPEVRARLDEIIDATVGSGLDALLAERALHRQTLAATDVEAIREQVEQAQARRLQPHFLEAFFRAAFADVGGRMAPREAGRFEITHVPPALRDRDRMMGVGAVVLARYERVTFHRERVRAPGQAPAELLAPGHPLLDAVVHLVIEQRRATLKHGAVLIDRTDAGETARLLVAFIEEIRDGHIRPHTVSKRFDYVEILPDGPARPAGIAPYLDYDPPTAQELELVGQLTEQPWLGVSAEDTALEWALAHSVPEHEREVRTVVSARVAKVRSEVKARLQSELNYWDAAYGRLLDEEAAGRSPRISAERARKRARDLEDRLVRRLAQLDADETLSVRPPLVGAMALVVPQGLVDRLSGLRDGPVAAYARETRAVERRAVDAVLAAERQLGRMPREMAHNHPGYDVRSVRPEGPTVLIEVKGRVAGADDFVITRNEVLEAKNLGDDYRLALVAVSPLGSHADEVRYLTHPFDRTATDDFRVTKLTLNWAKTWAQGGPAR